jgi:hypothetical protein
LKLEKNYSISKVTIDKQVGLSVPEIGTTIVAIDNHMAIIQIQRIKDVLLDGGSKDNIIT